MPLIFILSFLLVACPEKKTVDTPQQTQQGSNLDLINRGRTVYLTNCTSCHNSDPKKVGSIGPDVFGASAQLIEARILKAEYPVGYKPKRTTKVMSPLIHLKNDIPALTAFLNN